MCYSFAYPHLVFCLPHRLEHKFLKNKNLVYVLILNTSMDPVQLFNTHLLREQTVCQKA